MNNPAYLARRRSDIRWACVLGVWVAVALAAAHFHWVLAAAVVAVGGAVIVMFSDLPRGL